MMTTPSRPAEFITRDEARYLTLFAQRIETVEPRGTRLPTTEHLLDLVHQISVIQLDSISVVSRAHETSVWTRVGTFKTSDFSILHHPKAALFEYWVHAASLVPIQFFPYVRRQMESHATATTRWGRWGAENKDLLQSVLATIEKQGAVSTRAFERPEEIKRSPWAWFGGKPAKEALDFLWTAGELVVIKREGFERHYDLTDRTFPGARSGPLPSLEDQNRFFIERALRSVGIGTLPWLADFFRPGSSRYVSANDAKAVLNSLEQVGRAIPVLIESIAAPAWLDESLLPVLDAFRTGALRSRAKTLLSPFDNVMWRRNRALALWGFDYRIETYTPEPLRAYGYYSLPILIDGRFVGRLDPRYHRKEKLLSIKSIHLEPGIRTNARLVSAIASVLRKFTEFLGGGEIQILESNPEALKSLLNQKLR